MTVSTPGPKIDPVVEQEVKSWLRGSVLSPGVSTPLQFLYMAYRVQGGRRSAAEFANVILHACKGLRVEAMRGKAVVHGAAPRWTPESLAAAIRGRNQ